MHFELRFSTYSTFKILKSITDWLMDRTEPIDAIAFKKEFYTLQ